MSESITVGNKTFHISQKGSDRTRRQQYFTNGSGSLTPEEEKLLEALGIDSDLQAVYKLWLPTFFEQLPVCQSDTPLILSKSCEIPHFILWSVMFRSNQATQARVAQHSVEHQSLSDISIAATEEVIRAFQTTEEADEPSSVASSTRSPTPASARSPRRAKRPAPPPPTSPKDDDILRLFTIPYV